MRPAEHPRVRLHVLERRREVAQRYLRGERQSSIAQFFAVSQAQISMDLKAIHAEWLNRVLQDFSTAKAEELAKLDAIEREAWDAWQRSQSEAEVTSQSLTMPDKRKVSVQRKTQVGDARYLEVVLQCIQRRCALLGLDAPRQEDITVHHIWEERRLQAQQALEERRSAHLHLA